VGGRPERGETLVAAIAAARQADRMERERLAVERRTIAATERTEADRRKPPAATRATHPPARGTTPKIALRFAMLCAAIPVTWTMSGANFRPFLPAMLRRTSLAIFVFVSRSHTTPRATISVSVSSTTRVSM